MFSIDTDVLKTQAELLQQESRKFNQHLNRLDEIILWMKRQKFKDSEEFIHILNHQKEDMMIQKRQCMLLAESLQRISENYKNTDQKISDSLDAASDQFGFLYEIKLGRGLIPAISNIEIELDLKD